MNRGVENNCLKYKCGKHCCNPVIMRVFYNPSVKDKTAGRWEFLGRYAREACPDGYKVDFFKCRDFDEATGQCKDYGNRPEICKKTDCELFEAKNEEEARQILGKKEKHGFIKLYENKK